MMRFRRIIGLVLLGVFSSFADADRPNFILIFTDDQGYADLGCFGGDHVVTPNIDKMAAEGVKLTDFYVAGSVCTPSRSALMTGCYPKRIGLAGGVFLAGDKRGLNPAEITLAEVLKAVGYATGMFGKWHLGDQPEFLPTRQGFDEFFGLPYSWDIHPFHPNNKKYHFPPLPLLEGETVIEEEPDGDDLTQRITEKAVDFIKRHKEEPFFLYIPHPAPHRPIHVSPEFMEEVPAAIRAVLETETGVDYATRDKLYTYAIREIDGAVGQILDALKANGLDENTMVVFTSDNGPSVGSAGPLSGKKGSSYEGGMRVPAVIRWPGRIPAGQTIDELTTAMDLLPTLAKLAGAEIPSDRVIDGKDIWSVLTANAASPSAAFFYYKGNRLAAVRSGSWKLHIGTAKGNAKKGSASNRGMGSSSPITALYDLSADLGEQHNLLAEHPEVERRLRTLASAFEAELTKNSRPIAVVEHPEVLSK
jgi:arylsulfatase A-like enzyme